MAPVVSTAFFGVGASLLFNPIINYLTDSYPTDAASVLASVSLIPVTLYGHAFSYASCYASFQNDFIRSAFGAGMPLVAHGLYVNLKVDWGTSLLGFISLGFLPLPFVLYFVSQRERQPRVQCGTDITPSNSSVRNSELDPLEPSRLLRRSFWPI